LSLFALIDVVKRQRAQRKEVNNGNDE